MAVGTQDHIHLQGTDDRPWGAPELVPAEIYDVAAAGYARVPRVYVAIEEALDGTPHVHRLAVAGVPVQREDFTHALLMTHADLVQLLADVGKNVDFVDSYHPDDGEDASAYIDEKVLSAVADIRNLDPMLTYYTVQIILEDVG